MNTSNRRRAEAIKNLGGKCVVCGETCIYVLEIDHINNDGSEDRRKERRERYSILSRLAAGADLDRFQILCANCHSIKTKFGKFASLNDIRKIRESYSIKTIYSAKLEYILRKKAEKEADATKLT